MKIWVDADACPGPIKELIVRAAKRLGINTVFVANKYIGLPDSSYLTSVRIGVDPEAVDQYIIKNAESRDLAITQDIPLASALVQKGIIAISPRGTLFSVDNIGERLAVRNLMQDIRDSGGITFGPKQFGRKDRQRFADTLDRELTRCMR